jgi:hypothetical protein
LARLKNTRLRLPPSLTLSLPPAMRRPAESLVKTAARAMGTILVEPAFAGSTGGSFLHSPAVHPVAGAAKPAVQVAFATPGCPVYPTFVRHPVAGAAKPAVQVAPAAPGCPVYPTSVRHPVAGAAKPAVQVAPAAPGCPVYPTSVRQPVVGAAKPAVQVAPAAPGCPVYPTSVRQPVAGAAKPAVQAISATQDCSARPPQSVAPFVVVMCVQGNPWRKALSRGSPFAGFQPFPVGGGRHASRDVSEAAQVTGVPY